MPNASFAFSITGEEQNMDQIATNHGQREGLRDPVCGMATTTESEHQAIHDGETYYFCCARCGD